MGVLWLKNAAPRDSAAENADMKGLLGLENADLMGLLLVKKCKPELTKNADLMELLWLKNAALRDSAVENTDLWLRNTDLMGLLLVKKRMFELMKNADMMGLLWLKNAALRGSAAENADLKGLLWAALEVEREEDEGGSVGETFTDYRPSKLSIGPPHPDPVVETSSLSAVQPPEPTYELKMLADIEEAKVLSCLQLETIIYASQRHMQHLPDGLRAGFFIGDGAGVGKGRTVAGLVWENWQHQRCKALWLSVASDLKYDSRRDLDDVGASSVEVHALNKLPYGKLDSKAVGVKEGVLFLTYSSLIASSEKGKSRLQQLVQWCGPDFDGLLIFDECHKAKNLVPEAGGQATRTGEAVLEIQARLPEARVVYCSATGASEPRNMGYMARLGLWGIGTDFPNFQVFLGALEKRGVGALELVAMDMKARGMYVCRTLSFKGAEFDVIEVILETDMQNMYNKAARLWAELRKEFMLTISTLYDIEKPSSSQLWRLYWASHQRFFRHMCMSAKVPAAVRLAKQALEESKCVVIGLQSTGEARTEEAVSKYGNELDDFVSGPRELLLKLVEENYPLPLPANTLYEELGKEGSKRRQFRSNNLSGRRRSRKTKKPEDEVDSEEDFETESDAESGESLEGSKICRICCSDDSSKLFIECQDCEASAHYVCLPLTSTGPCSEWRCPPCDEAQRMYINQLQVRYDRALERKLKCLEAIRSFELPNNPLDDMIDQLGGPDAVAEITGRRGFLVRAANGKGVVYQSRSTKDVAMEMVNMHEKQQFMDGRKHVAIISEAGSAGVSLQADRRVSNQKRRVHITLELPWSADRAIQQFGRTHRSNQACAPEYRLLFTNLGGERRFASIVAKRLETLGALTQGDRRAGPSLNAYNYDSVYGKKALALIYRSIMEQCEAPVLPPGCSMDGDWLPRDFFKFARAALLAVGIIRDAVFGDNPEKDYGKPSGRIPEADTHDVARFLNRLLGLPPDVQNRLFEYFVSIFDLLLSDARREGQFDCGIVDIKAHSIELQEKPKIVHVDPMSGASTTLSILKVDRGLTWEAAVKILEQNDTEKKPNNGFYESKREWLGRAHYLLATFWPKSGSGVYRIFRPASGEALREMPEEELLNKYSKLTSLEMAEKKWQEEYNITEEQCMHGPKCKVGSACTVGRRVQEMFILGGLILPVWGTVEKALSKQERVSHRRLRVVWLETSSDNQRIVGLHIPNPAVNAVLSGLSQMQVSQCNDAAHPPEA
ncbi:hypothetical protein L7F22_013389 [Adiantum nelumboides]|nr:hypothetical protein [Adiantum nelumboides]